MLFPMQNYVWQFLLKEWDFSCSFPPFPLQTQNPKCYLFVVLPNAWDVPMGSSAEQEGETYMKVGPSVDLTKMVSGLLCA